MIIYGSRMYFKKNVVRSYGECEHCGKYGKKTSYRARKFGHIYFIPIFPLGGNAQVLRECKTCSMGSHIPTEKLEPMVDSLSDQFKSWIMSINDGETEISVDPDSPAANAGLLIAGILDDLYCLNEIENVDSIMAVLDANGLNYEREIVMGRWHEIQGDLDQAKNAYQAASSNRRDDSSALFQLGLVEILRSDSEGAEEAFHRYSELNPDDHAGYLALLRLHERKRDYDRLVPTCDILFERIPQLLEEKKLVKLYKKACKKSGLVGKFSTQL